MPALSDVRFDALRGAAFTGATSDMLLQFLHDGGATSPAVPDAWEQYLALKGYPVTGKYQRSDAWFEYLGSLGYTGNMNDREMLFWSNITFP